MCAVFRFRMGCVIHSSFFSLLFLCRFLCACPVSERRDDGLTYICMYEKRARLGDIVCVLLHGAEGAENGRATAARGEEMMGRGSGSANIDSGCFHFMWCSSVISRIVESRAVLVHDSCLSERLSGHLEEGQRGITRSRFYAAQRSIFIVPFRTRFLI